jgi:hypothetical protein
MPPTWPHERTLEVQGSLRTLGDENVSVLLQVRYDRYDTTLLTCSLTPLTDSHGSADLASGLSGMSERHLIVTSTESSEYFAKFRDFSGYSTDGSRTELFVAGFEWGLGLKPTEPWSRLAVTVELADALALAPDITPFGDRVYEGEIEWETGFAHAKAYVRKVRERARVGENPAQLIILRPSLVLEVTSPADWNLDTLARRVEEETEDASLLLSLCSRRDVRWYELNFLPWIADRPAVSENSNPLVRRRLSPSAHAERRDDLVDHRDLVNGGFANLLSSLRASANRDVLRRAISFLVGSWADTTAEERFFLCFAALEAVGETIYAPRTVGDKLPKRKWKELESDLRAVITDFAARNGLGTTGESLVKKLPDIKRVASREKIEGACRDLNVKVDDLWAPIGFDAGLGEAIKLRNNLFHRAHFEDAYLLQAHLVRLQVLTERLILKALDWPDEKIWRWHDQIVRWTRLP